MCSGAAGYRKNVNNIDQLSVFQDFSLIQSSTHSVHHFPILGLCILPGFCLIYLWGAVVCILCQQYVYYIFLSVVVRPFGEMKSEDEADPQFLPPIFLPSEYCDTLQGSMEQLAKGLETGVVLIQFEVIFFKV